MVALGLAGLLVLTACSNDGEPSPQGSSQDSPSQGSEAPSGKVRASERPDRGLPVPPDLVASFTRTLDRRSQAIRDQDRAAFARTLEQSDPDFLATQGVYFDNMLQLPLDRFALRLDRRSLVREGDSYWVAVEVRTELGGFDTAPVLTRDRYRLVPTGKRGRFVVSSVSDPDWEEANDVQVQPWDAGPIEVRRGLGVLGIFDPSSAFAARPLVRSVERAIADVGAAVPYEWSRSAVVYALSDTRFLTGLDGLPEADPEHLDGVAFSVPAAPSGGGVASTRVVLAPRMLTATPRERDRLVRHELTHVALERRDDRAPVWLSEGIAEYVSVRPLAPDRRELAQAALAAAKRGVQELPADEDFNGEGSAVNYGLSWWACEYLADTFGPQALFTLVDELGKPKVDPDQRFQELTTISTRALARRAAKLMVATYDPEPPRRKGNRDRSRGPDAAESSPAPAR